MPITYKVAKCRNPRNPDAEYYKGTAVKTGDYSFDDLAEDIALATTCTKGDILAVLASIKPFITKALLNGNRVVLNDLGAFHISVQGKCYPKEILSAEDFSPSAQIKSHKIVFRPDVALKKAVAADFSLKRISSEALA